VASRALKGRGFSRHFKANPPDKVFPQLGFQSSGERRQLYQIVLRNSLNIISGFSPRRETSHDNERVESVLSQ
jgi:hypothetical protein